MKWVDIWAAAVAADASESRFPLLFACHQMIESTSRKLAGAETER